MISQEISKTHQTHNKVPPPGLTPTFKTRHPRHFSTVEKCRGVVEKCREMSRNVEVVSRNVEVMSRYVEKCRDMSKAVEKLRNVKVCRSLLRNVEVMSRNVEKCRGPTWGVTYNRTPLKVCPEFFSKTGHRIFPKLGMKLKDI